MLRTLWRLTRGYRLTPWRSPYLRWRIETYSGLHAERITFRDFWSFVWSNRRELARYARWPRAPPAWAGREACPTKNCRIGRGA